MIKLIPIEQKDFDTFLEHQIADYAQEKVKSGNWLPEQALEKSRAEYQSILPDGLKTPGQYIFSILENETNTPLGVMWIQLSKDSPVRRAFINDFVIHEEHRGKGYGTQAMAALDEKLKEMEVESVALHVFAHNKNAIHLYEKMGYEVTNLYMRKNYAKEIAA